MIAEGNALLRAVLEDPADDLPRLAYADWLDEQGNETGRSRAEFIRAQVELSRIGHRPAGCGDRSCPCAGLSRRARSLARTGNPPNVSVWAGEPLNTIPKARYRFSRGFVAEVEMPPWWFSRHARDIFLANPVVAATLRGGWPVWRQRMYWWLKANDLTRVRGDESALPGPLFALLAPPLEEQYTHEGAVRRRGYEDRSDALADLSRTCIIWGRRIAGLPTREA
jgi:uncharacterized protein (TIGR02996 family)